LKGWFGTSKQDRFTYFVMKLVSISVILMLIGIGLMLMYKAVPAILHFGIKFIWSTEWNPVTSQYGSLPFIIGTLVTSFLALFIAAPFSVAVALFITEICPRYLRKILSIFVEMIASVPSIIFGLWGIFSLAPWMQSSATPFLKKYLGFLPLFQGPSFGISVLTASVILAIMITPTISSFCREVFSSVSVSTKEAALALGCTRYEMLKLAILRPSIPGIVGGMVLGLGRALGETMAVAMVIGNSRRLSSSLFAPGSTMASLIANEYAEATNDLHMGAILYIALLLLLLSLIINLFARMIIWKWVRR